ncbi:probable UDP-sugar transporter protein SLC35A4 [Physella acuta]|uniref:probable UDP-sugar transporter protein SLC35A4 n=1 Tax=Physella acuta TaxID=109671 RepID=UPI0027DDF7F1|nr:probable UDP-sugar transporter protein SLC35A4 [Physella acuta]
MSLIEKPSLLPLPVVQRRLNVESLVTNPVIWTTILIVEVFIYSSYGIFINLSRIDGHVSYDSSSMVLIMETIKFLLALLMAWPELSIGYLSSIRLKQILPFSLPAVCYCINNNLSVFMQDQMDPATFQVLCNLKIASTALLYRIIMRRKLRLLQWASLGLLTFAGGLNSYSGLTEKSLSLQEIHITLKGVIMALLYCAISGFAGVYTEYILKKDSKASLPLQNCYLYSFGILFNFCMWYIQGEEQSNFFHGYTKYTWLVIVSQAVNGLVMSLIMKHSSNIVRLFVITSAIPVATVLSILVFQLQPGFEFFIVVVIVILAIYLYNYTPSQIKH